jgi:pimeloyl-ACP methyl ester carboxylesterase
MDLKGSVESGPKLAITEVGTPQQDRLHLVWGHGWGQSAAALVPVAETLKPFASSSLVDFPGFGKSSNPPESWGTAEYADFIAEWMEGLPASRRIWIGHSFGGRVGIQLAARHPKLVSGMVLIASAGLQRRRTLTEGLRFRLRKTAFKTARRLVRDGPQLDALRQRFGSSDYRSAGAMRPILTRVVSEDLSEPAKAVQCPTLLVYGTSDTETPPEMGERYKALIPNSELAVLTGFDHLSVLSEGRHQLVLRIRRFLELAR